MSFASHKGEGEAAFQRFISLRRHNQSFLQRNVLKVVKSLTMGTTISTLTTSNAAGPKASEDNGTWSDALDEEDDDDEPRPAKRMKMSATDRLPSESPRRKPFGHVMNESRNRRQALAGKFQAVKPASFYGKCTPGNRAPKSPGTESKSSQRRGSIISTIFTPVKDFRKGLRINVASIDLDTPNGVESSNFMKGRKQFDIKCVCQIAIHFQNQTPPGMQPDTTEVYKRTKQCVLRTRFVDGQTGNVERKLVSLDPFFIEAEEIYINRRKIFPSGEIQRSFELADKYYVIVRLEAEGTQRDWPPFDIPVSAEEDGERVGYMIEPGTVTDLVNSGTADKSELHLYCQAKGILNPDQQNSFSNIKLCWGMAQQTMRNKAEGMIYSLRMSVSWSLPCQLTKLVAREEESQVEPHAIGIAHTPTSQNDLFLSPSKGNGLPKGVDTANHAVESRGQRNRSSKPSTYNLKVLSAQAQGKSPRKSTVKVRDSTEVSVTYEFGRPDATDYGVKSKTTVSGLLCPFCSREQSLLDNLRLHLLTHHDKFKFTLRNADPLKPRFSIEVVPSVFNMNYELQRTFQLGRPQSLFNLEKFLNRDESWVKARYGPLNGQLPDNIMSRLGIHESSQSTSPRGSRQSSPNTSNYTEMDCDSGFGHSMKPRQTFLVPKTAKPLYDTISKRILEPGEEVPSSDDEKDEGWLHQKHRDIVLDHSDVPDDEKDYILRWNPFIMNAQLTSENLPEAVLAFVAQNADWFPKRKSRKWEFSTHIETFVMRGVLEQEHYTKAIEMIRRAEKAVMEKRGDDVDMVLDPAGGEQEPAKLRGLFDCVCAKHTEPPDRVICQGAECTERFYHRKCAAESGRSIKAPWICNNCIA